MGKANTGSFSSNTVVSQLGYFLLVAILVAYGLYAAFLAAPAYRAIAQQQLAQALADEDRRFCGKFGIQAGTTEFRKCSEQLAVIRQNQADRDRASEAGIL
jgi:hypothetical protein